MADYNEQLLGDLSDDYTDPTNHEFNPGELVLFTGSNVVTGSTIGGNPPGDRDFFTFTVPDGFTVSAIILKAYQWGDGDQSNSSYGNSYFAIVEGSSFPSLTDDSTFIISKVIDDYTAETSEEGEDLLEPDVGDVYGGAGSGSLGTGTYSVWYQETKTTTTYEFDIVLDAPNDATFGTIQFSSSDVQVNEATGTVEVTLTRTGGSDGGVSVLLQPAGGTAENSSDFNFEPIAATFKDGETQKVFNVSIVDDTAIEGNETVTFELATPKGGATLGTTSQLTLTIADNDSGTNSGNAGVIQFGSNTVQVNEAAATASVTLTRTGGSTGAVSVQLNQTGGTAENPTDFTVTPVTVNFAAGETEKTVSYSIVDDTVVEGNETAIFNLINPTGNVTVGTTNQTTLTIVDNDGTNNPPANNPPANNPPANNPPPDLVLRGTTGPNKLVGALGNDTLLGLAGNDQLTGKEGKDRLKGGRGKDRFIFDIGKVFDQAAIGVDEILDFQPGQDKIVLDRTTFRQLGQSISFASVASRRAAKLSTATITYIASTGNLYYNQNRSAAGFGTGGLFAIVDSKGGLMGADFLAQV